MWFEVWYQMPLKPREQLVQVLVSWWQGAWNPDIEGWQKPSLHGRLIPKRETGTHFLSSIQDASWLDNVLLAVGGFSPSSPLEKPSHRPRSNWCSSTTPRASQSSQTDTKSAATSQTAPALRCLTHELPSSSFLSRRACPQSTHYLHHSDICSLLPPFSLPLFATTPRPRQSVWHHPYPPRAFLLKSLCSPGYHCFSSDSQPLLLFQSCSLQSS